MGYFSLGEIASPFLFHLLGGLSCPFSSFSTATCPRRPARILGVCHAGSRSDPIKTLVGSLDARSAIVPRATAALACVQQFDFPAIFASSLNPPSTLSLSFSSFLGSCVRYPALFSESPPLPGCLFGHHFCLPALGAPCVLPPAFAFARFAAATTRPSPRKRPPSMFHPPHFSLVPSPSPTSPPPPFTLHPSLLRSSLISPPYFFSCLLPLIGCVPRADFERPVS